jgi:class 3 adenylate cyclase/tetratricopeptide (TPR) repeat protein
MECGTPFGDGTTAPPRARPGAYTPKHLAEKILTSRSALEGERKQVTVLFADVKGSMDLAEGVDPEEWHRVMDRFFQILGEGVHRFEGTINQFTGDGIMALFGAPVAHEDHAQRACYASLYLSEELRRYADELKRSRGMGFAVRMGLNSGEVVVGKIGDDLRMDYTAHGHTVGIADRLQKLADPGTVYVSGDTASLVSGYFQLRDLGVFDLKGVREPIPVYQLQGAGSAQTRLDVSRARGLSRFIGRDAEMDVLEDALETAMEGSGRVVSVVGEAGIGKSRLCFEFVERCRTRGIEVHTAHAVPYSRAVPFFPILGLFRSYFGIAEQDTPQEARKKIAGTLLLHDDGLKETLPFVFDFLGVPDPDRPVPDVDPETRQRSLFQIFRGMCPHGCEKQNVILIEDLHWVDPGSEMFLAALARVVPESQTFLLLNSRPGYDGSWIQDTDAKEIRLLPLGNDAIAELICDLLGSGPEMEALAERIRDRAGGNPFFVEEVVQSLLEAGSLEGARGAYRLVAPAERLAIPPTVQAVLAARIDRLDEHDKEVLQTAAVIGKEFTEGLLAQVLGRPDAELQDALRTLEAGEFIYTERLYPTRDYAFKHPLTQEVVYGSQLADRRRSVHAAVARAIEGQCGEGGEDCAALMAHHYGEAGDATNAARWSIVAGNRANSVNVADALSHFRKALALLDGVPDTPETLGLALAARAAILRSAAFVPVSQEELKQVFAEGKAKAIQSQDQKGLAMLLGAYGTAESSSGDADRAVEHAREAVRVAREAADPEFESNMRAMIMFAYYTAGRLREALDYAADAERRLHPDAELGTEQITEENFISRGFRAMILANMGRLEEAERDLTRAIQVASELSKGFSWMRASLVDGAFLSGRTEIALTHARAAVESAERYGSPYFSANAHRALGLAQLLNLEWEEAIETLKHALGTVRETRTAVHLEAGILALLAEGYLEIGEEERAREAAEEAVRTAERNHTRLNECRALLTLARVLMRTEGRDAADSIRTTLERLSDLIEETGATSFEPFVDWELAELARLSGDGPAYETRLAEAHRGFEEIGATARAEELEGRFSDA